ncbi:Sensor histidine kinase LiaS [bacterium HR11]|nr:Sensor histidine kinase LiaS [bacterium HR11]
MIWTSWDLRRWLGWALGGLLGLGGVPGWPQQVPFRNYTARDGLPRNTVRTVYQDRQGFLWLGTPSGLSRYDGATFVHFTTKDGLPDDSINRVLEDSAGRLWIATNFNGLSRYRPGTFHNHAVIPNRSRAPENRVNAAFGFRDGSLWVGTDGGLFRWAGARFVPVVAEGYPWRTPVLAIMADRRQDVWVGTEFGLYRLRRDAGGRWVAIGRWDDVEVYCLAEDPDGNVWVGTRQGLKRIRPPTWEWARLPAGLAFLADKWIRAFWVDSAGDLWIGTNGYGVWALRRDGSVVHYTAAHGLAGNDVLDVFQDREGNLWFATTVGLSKLRADHIVNYTVADGLPDHSVNAVLQDGPEAFWFGTRLGLAKWAGGRIVRYTAADGLADDYVLALGKDGAGAVWVGTETGISRVVPTDRGERFVTYREKDGWIGRRARVLYRDDGGDLWVGHELGVSWVSHRGRLVNFPVRVEAPRALVTAIVRDGGGDLWVGFFEGGLVRLSVRTDDAGRPVLTEVARYGRADGMADDHIRAAGKDQAGHLWFGTRFGGVSEFIVEGSAVRAIRNYTTAQGLSSDWVSCILQDRQGRLWFGTDRGVDRLRLGPDGQVVWERLTPREGLAGDGVLACYEDIEGDLWFGTENGVTHYRPDFHLPAPPPPVYITQFQVFGRPEPMALRQGRADLGYSQHSVAFEFVGISLEDETRVRYRYMLVGLDKEWSGITDRRYVNFTHLPPGRYVFKVHAQNADGVWSETPAVFEFRIAAPFWQTAWFIALVIIGLTGLLTAVHHRRVRRVLEMERLRTRIATDLHDDLGSTLGSISVFAEMAYRETAGWSPKAGSLIRRIGENARAMLETLEDIVWTMNPEHDRLDDVLERIREFAVEVFEARSIELELDLPDADAGRRLRLPMELRRDFYLIFKETVHNVVRHARCQKARVTVRVQDHVLRLTVQDDGVGFDTTAAAAGDGLRNMERRARAIGGILHVVSQPGQGTTVTLEVPVP